MQIITLGTSSGTPTKQRNLSATVVKYRQQKPWILVDCGEATQHRLLHTSQSFRDLAAICITHIHGDHCYGLPGLLASAQMAGRQDPLPLIAPAGIYQFIQSLIQHMDFYLGYELQWIDVATMQQPLTVAGFNISAIPLSHRVPSFAYVFTETTVPQRLCHEQLQALGVAKGPLWGQLQRGESITLEDGQQLQAAQVTQPAYAARQVIVAGDNDTPMLLLEACRQSQLLLHESTYTEAVLQQVGPDRQHSSALRVAQMAQQVGLRNLILTHFSPRYQHSSQSQPTIDDIATEAQAHYQGCLFLANDLDVFELDTQGQLRRC